MDALGELPSSEESDSEGATEGNKHAKQPSPPRTGLRAARSGDANTGHRSIISYEDLQARGLSAPRLLDAPSSQVDDERASRGFHASDGDRQPAEASAGGSAVDDEDAPVEVFVNPFGKWEVSKHKRAKLEADRLAEAEERRAQRGPTWGEQRGEVLRARARHHMTHAVETFDLGRAAGAAKRERDGEAASKVRMKRVRETTRQKNARKEQRGQATFTVKEARDCPDVWRGRDG